MKIIISFTEVVFAFAKGFIRLGDFDKVFVGCSVEYACGDLGIPQELTWLNRNTPHVYGVGDKLVAGESTGIREKDLEKRALEAWRTLKPFFRALRKKGKLVRCRTYYGVLARALYKEGHQVWENGHWIDHTDVKMDSGCEDPQVCTTCGRFLYGKDKCECECPGRLPCCQFCGDTTPATAEGTCRGCGLRV